ISISHLCKAISSLDWLIRSVEIRDFCRFALGIVLPQSPDVRFLIKFELTTRSKVCLFEFISAFVISDLDLCKTPIIANRLITFVKTNRVDHVPVIVTSETGLSTAIVITNEAVFLIQAGHFHKMAALVPNSFAFDNIARDWQELAVRTKISFA